MFATDQVRFVGDVLAGTQNALSGNFILSGVLDRFSYSAGTFREKTDGIRDNNDLDRSIHNAFFQADLSHADSAQVELRWTDRDQGDPALFFDPESFSREYRDDSQTRSVRLGGRHVFSPSSMLIRSFVHRRLDADFTVDATYRVVIEEPAHFAEIRYLWNTRRVNLTAGSGLYRGQATETTMLDGTTYPPQAVDVRHTNGYVYLDSAVRNTFTVTTGLSIESFHDGDLNRRPLNPKFGVTWTPHARHDGSRCGVTGAETAADLQSDDRADASGRLQPVLRRYQRDRQLALRSGRGAQNRRSRIHGRRSVAPAADVTCFFKGHEGGIQF